VRLCHCPSPLRSTATLERLRCLRCAGWTPHGRPNPVERTIGYTNELISLATKLSEDWGWVYDLAHDPTRHGHSTGRSSGSADPTLELILTGERRPRIAAYATITSRLLDRAVVAMRNADQACGEALLAAEPPGPKDHTKAAFHDTGGLRYPEPEIYAAQARRHARGEGTPT